MTPSPRVRATRPAVAVRRRPPPTFRSHAVRVQTPATSANLGPGFDAIGLALGLHDDVVVRVSDEGLAVDVAGEDADVVPRDEQHLVVRAARAAFDALGGQPRGLEVVCANHLPHGRGLGSSAAAVVAGLLGARALVLDGEERLPDVLPLAAALEGHVDNVGACLLGGLVLTWVSDGRPLAARVEPAGVVPLVAVPQERASTAAARGLLPATVPHADAAASAGRAALLVPALTGRSDLLLAATEDRLHQVYRAPAMPASAALVTRLRAAGVAAMISGAGPSVLVLAAECEADEVQALLSAQAEGFQVLRPGVQREGARVLGPDPAG